MYLVDTTGETIKTLTGKLEAPGVTTALSLSAVEVDAEKREIRIGDRAVPYTLGGVQAMAEYVDIPTPWVKKEDPDLVAYVLTKKAQRSLADVAVRHTDEGIMWMRDPSAKSFEPQQILEVAGRVLQSEDAPIIDYRSDNVQMGFDVTVADASQFGIGGDRKVQDLTRGGLRFGRNVKQNLVPWVQPYMYRLVCTNGMEVCMPGLKVEGRGQTVEDVLANLEAMAELAFSRVEKDIEHFYAMREEEVAHPERTLLRMAAEHGISERVRMNLAETLPSVLPENGRATMFDIVNLVTNVANDPSLPNFGSRRKLQQFGGAMVTTHVERCKTCASKLVH